MFNFVNVKCCRLYCRNITYFCEVCTGICKLLLSGSKEPESRGFQIILQLIRLVMCMSVRFCVIGNVLPIDLTSVFTVLNDYSRLGIFCKCITSLSLTFRVITVFTVFRLLLSVYIAYL